MNDKLIMKDGKPHKIAEVVMFPTEKAQKNSLCLTAGSKLILLDGKDWETVNDVAGFRPQHLYILSDEEIKEGDWVLTKKYNNPVKANKFIKSIGWYYSNTLVNDICSGKKIIATTDESLEIACKVECHDCNGKGEQIMPYKDNGEVCSRCSGTGLEDNEKPFLRPSDDFLKAFVKAQGKGFSKIIVEYDYNCQTCDPAIRGWCCQEPKNLKLKVAPDNTITIKPFEEKTSWNREELTKHSEDMLRTIAKLKDCKILTQYELKYVNDLEISVNQLLD